MAEPEPDDEQQQSAEPSTSANDEVLNRGLGQHGCEHYRRRCLLVAPCCNEAFWWVHAWGCLACAFHKGCSCARQQSCAAHAGAGTATMRPSATTNRCKGRAEQQSALPHHTAATVQFQASPLPTTSTLVALALGSDKETHSG